MDWKKETMSAAELEKRQKEYMSAALSMMKRSSAAPEPEPLAVSEPEPEAPAGLPETPVEVQPVPDEEPKTDEEQKTDADPDTEKEPEKEPEPEPGPETGSDTSGSGTDKSYGVYTADELLSGEYHDDGLKKAAEILEEMTRNTAMMKKLADGDGGSSDTTDFPEFSCGTDGEEEDTFRGSAEAEQEYVPSDE